MESIKFSLTYSALKMFGRQLYSNAWAAISELVANGFDAGASDVYLYIDMRDKKHSIVELIDNGCGMDENDLKEKYVIIGRNRRLYTKNDNATGRKGIGKLAALYLSDKYAIISRKNSKTIAYKVDVSDMNDDTIPELIRYQQEEIQVACSNIWDNQVKQNGTIIQLKDVDLSRLGDAALAALKQKLSNYFLYDNMKNNLNVCFIKTDLDAYEFDPIRKQIAFDNMAAIYCSDKGYLSVTGDYFHMDYRNKLEEIKTIKCDRKIKSFPEKIIDVKNKKEFPLCGKAIFYGIEKTYQLTGWIGIHSSIETLPAQNNDKRYIKNQFYNPNQIRIYVRNKLANENILNKLGFTAQYANYLEGELSFDILDDNDFDDIATANRQEFSIEDERVQLMFYLIRGIARQLLIDRQELTNKINAKKVEEDAAIRAKEKSSFTQDLKKDLVSVNVPEDVADTISPIIGNKLKGNYELKTSYKLFISHAKKDRIFTDFIAHYLQHRGFTLTNDPKTTDIFYSSDGLDITSLDPLSVIIKDMIMDHNTDILFFTSKNFMKSQYCLFEGGAAWATRAILGYSIMSVDYNSIPAFLTNGKPEFAFDSSSKESFILDAQNYKNIVSILNRAINHLNNNRRLKGKPEVSLIKTDDIPDKVQMQKEGKTIEQYMDKEVYDYWQEYVIKEIDKYLSA